MLLSLHNVTFLVNLSKNLRKAIIGGYLDDFVIEFYAKYGKM